MGKQVTATPTVSSREVKLREKLQSVLISSDWSLKLQITRKSCAWGESPVLLTLRKRFAAEQLQPGQPRAWMLNCTERGGWSSDVPRAARPSVALLSGDVVCVAA